MSQQSPSHALPPPVAGGCHPVVELKRPPSRRSLCHFHICTAGGLSQSRDGAKPQPLNLQTVLVHVAFRAAGSKQERYWGASLATPLQQGAEQRTSPPLVSLPQVEQVCGPSAASSSSEDPNSGTGGGAAMPPPLSPPPADAP